MTEKSEKVPDGDGSGPMQVPGIRNLPTGNLTDAMGRIGAMDSEIKPLFEGAKVAGPAVTVRMWVGDNLACHKAIGLAQDGDVIVIDTAETRRNSPWGAIMSMFCKSRGINGVVIDGSARDVAEIKQMRFPVFARSATPNSCVKETFGAVNVPIQCGGVKVEPGDLIVGDDDGVVVVPKAQVDDVVARATKIAATEANLVEAIGRGELRTPFLIDVDAILREKGVTER